MEQIAKGVWWVTGVICNSYIVESAPDSCVLVDAGPPGWERVIFKALRRIRGGDCVPRAIVLTHGHYERIGAAHSLAHTFGIPIYAHPLELPYLDGRSSYPPADPTVGGFHSLISRFRGRRRLKLGPHLQAIPAAEDAWEGGYPEVMPGWRWVLTPGHTPGHIALFRSEDRVLLAGDACASVNMDSWVGTGLRIRAIWRAGTPFVYDWNKAKESVRLLARLQPRVLACGYGQPIGDSSVVRELGAFAENFPVPCHGRYVKSPAEVGPEGISYLPEPALDTRVWFMSGAALALIRACYTSSSIAHSASPHDAHHS